MSLFLVFAVGQVYLGMSLAATKSPANLPAVGMPQFAAILQDTMTGMFMVA